MGNNFLQERNKRQSLHDEANEPLYNKAKKLEKMPASERAKIIKELRAQMLEAAKNLEFEKAIALREEIKKLKEDYVDVIASDSHGIKNRACHMLKCFEMVSKKFDDDLADRLFISNPSKILMGEIQ